MKCPSALLALAGLVVSNVIAPAQTFTNLHSFTALQNSTNSDGANPVAGLILSDNVLYGTAKGGGGSGNGTVFKVNTDGTGFTILHSFTALSFGTNCDGAHPYAVLLLSSNTLYGTAIEGGSSGAGTVFKVNGDGTGFTNLHSFAALSSGTNGDGASPGSVLAISGNTLFGTAGAGGNSGAGTVFKVNTDGTGFTNLHSFAGFWGDGYGPGQGLILSGSTLYGTAYQGGNFGDGTVFKVNTDGTVFKLNSDGTGLTNLHSFSYRSDGANPFGGVISSGDMLYGTARYGGSSDRGTVFKVYTDGTGFTNLHNFTGGGNGAYPHAGLILSGSTLYGTTSSYGDLGYGTVFKVTTDGTGFTNVYNFTGGSDGRNPYARLILSGNILYGTTSFGGDSDNGTVFSLSLPVPPQLTIIPSGTDVILAWPTNAGVFTLRSTPDLVSPVVWTNVSPEPVVVNGQNTVTNPISGTQQFYRLSQ